jgi:hypothetical protein
MSSTASGSQDGAALMAEVYHTCAVECLWPSHSHVSTSKTLDSSTLRLFLCSEPSWDLVSSGMEHDPDLPTPIFHVIHSLLTLVSDSEVPTHGSQRNSSSAPTVKALGYVSHLLLDPREELGIAVRALLIWNTCCVGF